MRKTVLPRDLISPAVNKEALETGKKLLPTGPGKAQRKRVCTGKEEGAIGYAVFEGFLKKNRGNGVEIASSDAMKGRGQSGIGMEPHRENRGMYKRPGNSKTGG